MRFLFFCLSLLFLTGCGSANRYLEGQTCPRAYNPLEDRPYVVGWVDGNPVKLAVDTGAAQETLLFADSAERLGGRVRGRGDIKTSNLRVVVYDGQPENGERQAVVAVPHAAFSGLMGWPMIRRFVWHLDFPRGEHEFVSSVPFLVRNGQFSMKLKPDAEVATLADKNGHHVVLDTGAPYGIYLNESHWREWKRENPYAFITLYQGYSPASGGAYVRECARAESYTVNGLEFKNIIIAESFVDKDVLGVEQDIDIVIGLDALKSRELWLDGPGNRLYFGASKSKQGDPAPLNLVGVAFTLQSEDARRPVYELTVLENSVAWNSGLRTGDRLVSLNLQKYPDAALIDYLTTQPGVKAGIVVSRKGKIRRFKWTVPTEESLQKTPPADNGNGWMGLLSGWPDDSNKTAEPLPSPLSPVSPDGSPLPDTLSPLPSGQDSGISPSPLTPTL